MYKSFKANENGKHPLTPNPKEGFERVTIPCGKCLECRLKKAKEWSIRCCHEAKYHKESCFLTLTYDESHVPYNNGVRTLEYKDVQLFLKRLRKELSTYGIKIRYFCGAEYGGKLGRPHYHMILFGFIPKDLVKFRQSYSGLPIYRSKFLEKHWRCGFVFVGTATGMSAGYVARYTLEKFKKKEEGFYEFRQKEAIRMSRRNGIGFNWISQFWKNVCSVGYIIHDNIKSSIPRFYRNVIERNDPKKFAKLKKRLTDFAKKKHEDLLRALGDFYLVHKRAEYYENYKLHVTSKLKRHLTNPKMNPVMMC